MNHPQIAMHAFNRPLLVDMAKAQAFVSGLGNRLLGQTPEFVGGVEAIPEAAYRTVKPFASLLDGALVESVRQGARRGYAVRDRVAVIPVTGVLVHRGAWIGQSSGQTSYEGIAAAVEAARDDDDVRGIALEIDSYGGQVAGCFDLAALIRDVGTVKPVRAFVAEHAFSAGYAIASQAERIVLPATGGVGSIGVICMHVDYSRQLEGEGIRVSVIHAGARKADGNPYEPLPEDVRGTISAEMEALRLIFVQSVAAGRGTRLDAAAALATEARSYMGAAAIDAGLADEVAPPREAFERFVEEMSVIRLSGLSGIRIESNSQKDHHMDNETKQPAAQSSAAPGAPATGAAAQASETPAASPVAAAVPENVPATAAEGANAKGSERIRIAKILGSPEAEGRRTLASHLALETDLDPAAAEGILKVAAKDAGGSLAGRMAHDDTDIGSPAAEQVPGARAVDAVRKKTAA